MLECYHSIKLHHPFLHVFAGLFGALLLAWSGLGWPWFMNVMLAGFFGGWEIVLILAVVLILFGAKKLPELAKGLGQGIKEFKKATSDVTDEIKSAMDESPPPPPRRLPPANTAQTEPQQPVVSTSAPESKP